LLRSEGCFAAILGVKVDLWLKIGPPEQDQLLKSLLRAALMSN
jgi:hypothetical protein